MGSSLYSDQITNLRAGTPNDSGSAIAVFPFSYTVPTATIAAADTLFVTKIPKYFKPMLGFWTNTAGGAAATGKIGVYNASTYAVVDDDWLGALTDMTNITSQFFANTPAYHCGAEMAADYFVGVLTAAAAVQAAAQIHGWIMGRL